MINNKLGDEIEFNGRQYKTAKPRFIGPELGRKQDPTFTQSTRFAPFRSIES